MWLIPNALCCSLYKRNWVCSVTEFFTKKISQLLRVTRKRSCTSAGNAQVPGGRLVERWVRGCVVQIGCFFGLSGLPMAPFLFESWFRYRSRFSKIYNFWWSFPLVYLQVVKKYLRMPIYMVKSTDWFKKRAFQETNGLDIRQKLAFSLVSYRVVVKTSGRTSVPNSKLSTPPGRKCSCTFGMINGGRLELATSPIGNTILKL